MLVLGHEPVPAPEERRGFSPEPEEPGRGPLGPVVRWWRAKPLSFRRRVWTAVVALHYLVVVGWGTYYNVQVYLDASATRAELERQVRAVETLPAVLQQIAEEREAAASWKSRCESFTPWSPSGPMCRWWWAGWRRWGGPPEAR